MNRLSKMAVAAAALSLLAPASMTIAAPKAGSNKTFKAGKGIGAAKKKAQSTLPVGTEVACAIGIYVEDPSVVVVAISPLAGSIKQGTPLLILPLDANGSAVTQLRVLAPTDMIASPGQMYEVQRADPAWQDCVAQITA